MDLRDYEALKFRLAEVLRGVETALWRRGERPDALRPLYRRLAEDRFNVVVVGRFSRGKTSLMNAMLGRDWLPTAAVPLTSVITAVKYGSEPKAVLYYHHTSLFMDVKLWELPQHITERGNPGNRRGVSVAEVELPAEILRHGIYFVDTPGLGSSIAENTRNTERFLPEADALILVTSFDSPLSEEEVAIAALANASGRKLFVVLNKQDAVAASERAEVEAHVAARLDQVFAGAAPPAFPLSAADGLAARSCGDAAALAASGVPAFEAALGTFLANERRRNFVLAMCERLAALLQQQDLPAHLATLQSVRASVTADRRDKTTSSVALPALLADCEICAAAATAAFDALAKLQLDVSGEPASREALAREAGLCRWHLQQFQRMATTQALSIAMAQVAARQADILRGLSRESPSGPSAAASIATGLPGTGACRICIDAAPATEIALAHLAEVARDAPARVHQRSALCLPHFTVLLTRIENPENVQTLLRGEAALLERLLGEAEAYSLKHSAGQRHAASREELAAAERLLRVAGTIGS